MFQLVRNLQAPVTRKASFLMMVCLLPLRSVTELSASINIMLCRLSEQLLSSTKTRDPSDWKVIQENEKKLQIRKSLWAISSHYIKTLSNGASIWFKSIEKKEEVWPSRMTNWKFLYYIRQWKPKRKHKNQRRHQNFGFTTIADQLQ